MTQALSFDALSSEELEREAGERLPDREAMSLVNANLAAPINLAAALNVLSDNSTALAGAQQVAPIESEDRTAFQEVRHVSAESTGNLDEPLPVDAPQRTERTKRRALRLISRRRRNTW